MNHNLWSSEEKPMSKSVLIVDDHEMMQKFLAGYLRKSFQIEVCENGVEALDWLGENKPDIILADIDMPEMDGVEFLKRLKSDSYKKDIPVVMLSSINKSDSRVQCLQLGAIDFVTKPFNPKELELKINLHLGIS